MQAVDNEAMKQFAEALSDVTTSAEEAASSIREKAHLWPSVTPISIFWTGR
ncbi:TPA: hypothetical protein U1729_001311 [Streptococcus suis]|nr:hypothetical protein [Streptococcus suis]HEM5651209.1 hypothetical protein [Streptococcus suis]